MNLSTLKWAQWDKTQSRDLLVCSYVCALHCAQLLHTILHRTDLIIFSLTLQTITTAPMMSIWGKGGCFSGLAEYWKHFMARLNNVHVSGCNSNGCEQIWMKFGALQVYCLELALADFGRDLHRSKSGRVSQNFVFFVKETMHDFTNFRSAKFHEIYTQDVDLKGGESFRKQILKILPQGGLFFQKGNFCAKIFTRLPTSSRDFPEMITNRGKSRWIGQPTEFWLSICTVGINSKSFPCPVQHAYGEHTVPKTLCCDIHAVLQKRCNITNSFARGCHPANLDAALLLI